MTRPDPERPHAPEEARLGDLEFKLAFLERELETWKDAVDSLHARLERAEAELRRALRELREGTDPDPSYVGGTSESTGEPPDASGDSVGS